MTLASVTVGAILLVGTLRAANLWQQRRQTIAAEEARVNNLAILLSEYVRESFAAGDVALQQLQINSRRIGGPMASEAEWGPILASARSGLAGVGAVTVTDENGIIRHSLQPRIVGESRRDLYLFQQLSKSTDDSLVVDRPFLSVSEPRIYLIPIGRRLTDASGRFVGTVVTTFTPAALRTMFRSADVGTRGQVTVFHPSGIVLVREPDRAATGRLITRRHAAGDVPVTVAVSVDQDEVLALWRRETLGSIVFISLVTPGACVVLLLVFRQMDAKARVEAELRRVEAREAEELREAHDRLKAASELKDQFLMTVSHELRTPLTAISGWAELLVRDALQGDQRAAAIDSIVRAAQTQSHLVEDLLDMSRIVTGGLRLDVKAVDMGELVCTAVDSLHPAARAKHITVDVSLDPASGTVAADPARLQQVLWNLLANAVKFTPEGGRIDVRLEWRDGDCEVSIRDSGVGIEADFLPFVFERFRQADAGTSRRFSGLGLGLSIAQHLIELHGGSIVAESDGPGRGATFRVRVPHAATAALDKHVTKTSLRV